MIQQRFIELGQGYSDIYELFELMSTNAERMYRAYVFVYKNGGKEQISLAVSFSPAAADSSFMPIYICREGIMQTADKQSKRVDLFMEHAASLHIEPVRVEVKSSSEFAEKELFYQYITGVLRLNHLLPPLS